MSGGTVDIAINGDGVDAAAALNASLADLTGLFSRVAATYAARVQGRFDSKTDPDRKPWPAWAPSTAKLRARKGFSQPSSILQLHNPGLRNTVSYTVTAQGATVTVGADYAGYHEQIDGPGKGIIPRRAFLLSAHGGLGQDDADAIATTVQSYFEQLIASLP
ncbi:Mu-like prophage protein gpG [Burkholderia sp. YR290]|nr:Mu-like prophage protein gpG [Burkholderia sp. YR290]